MFRRFLAFLAVSFFPAFGQIVVIGRPLPTVVHPLPIRGNCRIESVDVHADIQDQAAKVRLSQTFRNPSPFPMEAQVLFPLPEGAVVSGVTLLVDGKELAGKLLGRDEARRTYEEIVRRRRDPALVEYVGRDLFQTSVFPVAPGGESTVELQYSQLLKKDSGLIDFGLPLGTAKHSEKPLEHLTVSVNIAAPVPIRAVYSPTHEVDIARPDLSHATVKMNLRDLAKPDDFRLLYSTDASPVGLNVISYKPEDSEDGYFALLATPDTRTSRVPKLAKTMLFLCDRSGSMAGPKIAQVKSALVYLLHQLDAADTFNVIAYDSEVEAFRPELQRANGTSIDAAISWVNGIEAGGGTNIDGALHTGLRMLTDSSRPNYVLFMTDGEPTVGERNEMKITENAERENRVNARLFAFGVGFDVNARLLDRVARELRGTSIYVKPNENIEAPVSAFYGKIAAPMMTAVAVDIQLDGGSVARVYPRQMPDLFRGDQLMLVGRYRKGGAAKITLTGDEGGKNAQFTYNPSFETRSPDETNAFVARLWATRRIGEIIDDLDLHGRNKELIDELVGLSQKYGILTPYTSFLTEDNVRLTSRAANNLSATDALSTQMVMVTGQSAVEQRQLKARLQNASVAAVAPPPPPGRPADQAKIQQIGQKVFFRQGRVWQDSTVTAKQSAHTIHVVQFSKEFFDLAAAHGGAMAQYLALDEPVVLNLGSQTYEIDPEPR
ncbi:MAG TPA: VIT and VWA domain-containing protein [Bryobacteraceae bacterium]|nr:VIT and VWA domain-containing protein [Bryobacteraceae bacterium]